MSFEVKAPSPGESINEVLLSSWYKKDGELVKKGEIIAEIESEKATLDLPADEDGILKIQAKEGETVSVGDIVAIIEPAGENEAPLESQETKLEMNEGENHNNQETQESSEGETSENQETKEFSEEETSENQETKEDNEGETSENQEQEQATKVTKKGKCFDIIIPSPGESITQVEIGKWFKKDGDFVHKNEDLLEIESEKANLPITAEFSGILKIQIQQGETANVGDIAGIIEESAQEETAPEKETTQETTETPEQETAEAPEQETTQAPEQETAQAPEQEPAEAPEQKTATTEEIIASPSAQKLMEKENIDLKSGTGKGGRITKQDVVEKLAEQTQAPEQKPTPAPEQKTQAPEQKPPAPEQKSAPEQTPPAPEQKQNPEQKPPAPPEQNLITRKLQPDFASTPTENRKTETKKISNIRKRIAERLWEAKQNTAMLTTFNEVNMEAILKVRQDYKDIFQKAYDTKLGFLSFFVKACCLALKEYPEVGSQLNLEQKTQTFFHYVDMGIAVSSPRGLMVPVLKNSDKLSLASIEKEIIILATKARDGKLTVEEMQGGTFTITNGGIFGSMLSTPILNPPQSAILGMHNIVERAIVIDGKIEIAKMMYVALSYDHRVIDGKSAVGFLVRVKEYLENPVRMLLEV